MLAYRLLSIAARLLLALGVSCGLLGIYLVHQAQTFLADSARTTGEVVSYREVRDGDTVRYRPRFRFKTDNGSIVAFEGQLATTRERFAIGAQVPIVYPIATPQKARVALFVDNWLGPCIAAVVGLVGLAGGWLVRRSVRRELAKSGA